jgi:hypothetical protein
LIIYCYESLIRKANKIVVFKMEKASPELKKTFIEVIKNQLATSNPPETKQAYMRLLGEGISEEDVYIYLAQALACELFAMTKNKRPYDNVNYASLLAKLPNLDK